MMFEDILSILATIAIVIGKILLVLLKGLGMLYAVVGILAVICICLRCIFSPCFPKKKKDSTRIEPASIVVSPAPTAPAIFMTEIRNTENSTILNNDDSSKNDELPKYTDLMKNQHVNDNIV